VAARSVVVGEVLRQDPKKVELIEDDDLIQAFSAKPQR
jgi:hypothetical protein